MTLWLMILGMVIVTYSVRLSVMAWLGGDGLPPVIRRGLRYVPPAALTAIIAPALLMPEGRVDVSPGNLRLIAGVVAAVVAWRSVYASASTEAAAIAMERRNVARATSLLTGSAALRGSTLA